MTTVVALLHSPHTLAQPSFAARSAADALSLPPARVQNKTRPAANRGWKVSAAAAGGGALLFYSGARLLQSQARAWELQLLAAVRVPTSRGCMAAAWSLSACA